MPTHFHPGPARMAWELACKRSGVKMRPYDIRHLAATMQLAAGADIAAVSAQLGHAAVSTTVNNYAHVTAGSQQRAAELMPQIDLVQLPFSTEFTPPPPSSEARGLFLCLNPMEYSMPQCYVFFMSRIFFLFFLILTICPGPSMADPDLEASVAVCFTPGESCDKALIDIIDSAQSTVRMAAYSMTSQAIADALIAARARGVKVWVVLDAGQWEARSAQGHRLRQNGVGVRYDHEHQLMHHKYIIIDIQQTATGSYNFTDAAQRRNAENLIILDDKKIARKYADNWGWHWSHSKKIVR